MRPAVLVLFLSLLSQSLPAQYFLTGEVVGPHGDKLQNVAITIQSTGAVCRSGLFGEFRIASRIMDDSVTFAADGYQSYTTTINTTGFLQVTLQMTVFDSVSRKGGRDSPAMRIARRDSVSVSFAGGIRRESYSTVRRFLDMGFTVPPDAVKIEEMLNYFNFSYEEPEAGKTLHCSSDLLSCPWNASHKLLFLTVCARKVDIGSKPPGNFVFLIDASGSMDMPNKMPLVKSGFRLLIDNLREIDTVSLVGYGKEVRVLLAGVPGSEKARIARAVEQLRPDGPSPGGEGLRLAYQVARQQFIPGGNNRVILITDGNINAESPDEKGLEDLIEQQSEGGIRLTCGGIGMGSFKDSRLPVLAEKGRGNFAYLDDEPEVEQLLAGELDGTLGCVADSVCITTDFNPLLVSEYRLLGFENRRGVGEDVAGGPGGRTAGNGASGPGNNGAGPRDSASELGHNTPGLEVRGLGSGHSLMALFELVPRADTTGADTLADVRINYCIPGKYTRQSMRYDCMNDVIPFDKAGVGLKRAACIAMFGMKLRQSGDGAQMDWVDLQKMARKMFSGNNFLDYEYLTLIDRARKIYERR